MLLSTVTICKGTEFRCSGDNGECIPKTSICDGKSDCLDDMDEEHCSGTSYTSGTLHKTTRVGMPIELFLRTSLAFGGNMQAVKM